ncbi:hypothetical protein AB0G42_23255 [Streptomyces yangpuensis]|uniref:hypothetical protein n=1 Tax=Streptomyces yangpuensis TaxID=1648182 RepID=UPI00342B13A0
MITLDIERVQWSWQDVMHRSPLWRAALIRHALKEQTVDAGTPQRNPGVIALRFVELVVRYAITLAITWGAVEASLPAELRFGASGLLLFVIFLGIPSILISFIYGLASRHTGIAFRGRLAGLLLLPLWFLLALPPLLPVYAIGQLVFALCMMRTPLMGPPRLRRQARAALSATARRAHALASRIGRVAP